MANEQRALQGKNRIGDFLSGKPTAPDENYENMKPVDWCQAHGQCKNITHCSSQESKKLKVTIIVILDNIFKLTVKE